MPAGRHAGTAGGRERFAGLAYTSRRSDPSSRAVWVYTVHRAGCGMMRGGGKPLSALAEKLGDRMEIKIAAGSVRPCQVCKPEVKP